MSKAQTFIWDWALSMDILTKVGSEKTGLSFEELRALIMIHQAVGKDFNWSDIFNFLTRQTYKKLTEAEIHNAKVSVTRFIGKLIKVDMCTKTKDAVDKRISHYHLTDKAIKFINDFETKFNEAKA